MAQATIQQNKIKAKRQRCKGITVEVEEEGTSFSQIAYEGKEADHEHHITSYVTDGAASNYATPLSTGPNLYEGESNENETRCKQNKEDYIREYPIICYENTGQEQVFRGAKFRFTENSVRMIFDKEAMDNIKEDEKDRIDDKRKAEQKREKKQRAKERKKEAKRNQVHIIEEQVEEDNSSKVTQAPPNRSLQETIILNKDHLDELARRSHSSKISPVGVTVEDSILASVPKATQWLPPGPEPGIEESNALTRLECPLLGLKLHTSDLPSYISKDQHENDSYLDVQLSPFLDSSDSGTEYGVDESNGCMERIPIAGRKGAISAPSSPTYTAADNLSLVDGIHVVGSLIGLQDDTEGRKDESNKSQEIPRWRRRANSTESRVPELDSDWRLDSLRRQKELEVEEGEAKHSFAFKGATEPTLKSDEISAEDQDVVMEEASFTACSDVGQDNSPVDLSHQKIKQSKRMKHKKKAKAELASAQVGHLMQQLQEESRDMDNKEVKSGPIKDLGVSSVIIELRRLIFHGKTVEERDEAYVRYVQEIELFQLHRKRVNVDLWLGDEDHHRICTNYRMSKHPEIRHSGLGLFDTHPSSELIRLERARLEMARLEAERQDAANLSANSLLSPQLQKLKLRLAAASALADQKLAMQVHQGENIVEQDRLKLGMKRNKMSGGKGAKWAATKRKGILPKSLASSALISNSKDIKASSGDDSKGQ